MKCDERADSCLNCEKADLCCPGYPEKPEALSTTARRLVRPSGEQLKHHTVSGVKRRRLVEACSECRRQKERCSADRPACTRCKRTGKPCHYRSDHTSQVEAEGRRDTKRTSSSTSNKNGTESNNQPEDDKAINGNYAAVTNSNELCDFLPSRDTIIRLSQVYFLRIAPLQCFGFIHRPTLLDKLNRPLPKETSIDSTLWLSLCILSTTSVPLPVSS